MEYPMIDPQTIKQVIGDRLLVEWEEATDLLGGKLIQPNKERHYTGVVIKVGPLVDAFASGIFIRRDDIEKALKDARAGRFLEQKLDEIDQFGEAQIRVGTRVFFEQFSNFEKFQSPDGKKRYAFIRASDCNVLLPPRSKVACEDWTQYGEGTD